MSEKGWNVGGLWVVVCGLLWAVPGVQGADIAVVKSGARKTALDLSGLRGGGAAYTEFAGTLRGDLQRSGWFEVSVSGGGVVAVEGGVVDEGGGIASDLRVFHRATAQTYLTKRYAGGSREVRRLAHKAADDIVQALTGKRGIASTRILMVGKAGATKNIFMCDADGGNVVQLTKDNTISMAPGWTPDAAQMVYTSFLAGYPDTYIINLSSFQRRRVSGFPGLNSGSDVSPDGGLMALTLSKDGNPELYVMSLFGGAPTRLTRTRDAAEASPSWSPDGRELVFVSDRSRRPQLFVIGRGGGQARLLTSRGSENVAPDWGSDGRIAYSSLMGGRYQICVIDPKTRESLQLTDDGADHEDPSWAPDGRHIVYCRTAGYRSDLYVLDTLGDPEIRLTTVSGDWSSPAWSPK